MATEIVMPKLGMVMTEGTISKWNRAQGEDIAQGEVVLEIETEKLNYELEATSSGKLHHIAPEGAIIPVNGLLGYLLAEGEAPPEVTQNTSTANESEVSAQATDNKPVAGKAAVRGEAYLPRLAQGNWLLNWESIYLMSHQQDPGAGWWKQT
ncbi:MAG: hypothetical protein CM1200mP8_2570 [Chloroflexota bacterium]|nr:MAG: hypothetical protein CM1200mP8_2570 [Chloroflexota bacterium]